MTTLTINRLIRREIDTMIDNLAGDLPVPTTIRQDIIERSDGVPLFVEELTKAVLEAENQSASDRITTFRAQVSKSRLRCTPRSWLVSIGWARRSKWHKSALRLRESSPMLCWLPWRPNRRQNSNPHSTVSLRLVCCFGQGIPPHAIYLFKHALVQDAAYGTLLREPRRALHARIAETLESQFRRYCRKPA